jgi:hypothetical protein
MTWWLPTIRSRINPALASARTARLPLTAGSRAAAMLGGDGHASNFRMGVRGDRKSVTAPKLQDGANRFLRVGESLLFRVALGDDLGKGRDEHCEAATLLRFKNDREAIVLCHEVTPSLIAFPIPERSLATPAGLSAKNADGLLWVSQALSFLPVIGFPHLNPLLSQRLLVYS